MVSNLRIIWKQINPSWAAATAAAHAHYNEYCEPVPIPGAVQLTEIVAAMDGWLAPHSIITNGAGNYASYAHRYYRYKAPQTQLAPTRYVIMRAYQW